MLTIKKKIDIILKICFLLVYIYVIKLEVHMNVTYKITLGDHLNDGLNVF